MTYLSTNRAQARPAPEIAHVPTVASEGMSLKFEIRCRESESDQGACGKARDPGFGRVSRSHGYLPPLQSAKGLA